LLGYGVPAEWLEDVRRANEDTGDNPEITRPRGSFDEPRLSGLIAAAKPPRLG